LRLKNRNHPPPQENNKRGQNSIGKGFVIGLLVIFLLFLKNSFSLGVLILGGSWFFFETDKKRYLQGFVIGGLLMFTVFASYYQFNLYPFIRDQLFVTQARLEGSHFSDSYFLGLFREKTFIDNLYIILAAIFTCFYISKFKIRLIFLSVLYLMFGYLFSATIMQYPEHILSSFFGFIMIFYISKLSPQSNNVTVGIKSKIARFFRFGMLTLSFLIVLKLIIINVIGMISETPRLLGKSPPTFDLKESRKISQKILPEIFVRNFKPSDELILVGENNLLPYQSLSIPKSGGLLYWHDQVTFSERLSRSSVFFRPENIFRSNSLIILSSVHHADSVAAFMSAYGDYIRQNYYLVDFSDKVQVYRRIQSVKH